MGVMQRSGCHDVIVPLAGARVAERAMMEFAWA